MNSDLKPLSESEIGLGKMLLESSGISTNVEVLGKEFDTPIFGLKCILPSHINGKYKETVLHLHKTKQGKYFYS